MGSTRATDEKEKGEKWLLLLGFQWWHNCLQPHQSALPSLGRANSCTVGTSCSTCHPSACLSVTAWGHLHREMENVLFCYPMGNGVSLSPPNSSASADAERIRRKDLQVINFCHKSERREKNRKKMGWFLKGFWAPANFGELSKASTGSHAGLSHDSKAARAQAGKAQFGNGESSVAQPMAIPQHFPTAPWESTTCAGEIFLQLLLCVTNKLVYDIFSGKAAPGVILKSLEELLRAAVNSEKELGHCHCWSLKSYTLWTNLGLFILGLLTEVCVTRQLGLF